MAEPYKFSGNSGLFFEGLYSSQSLENRLEEAMAQVCPCFFYFDGTCKIKADTYGSSEEAENPGEDLKTPCVGAKVRCQYYTGNFKYLTKKYVKDGGFVLPKHIIEIFKHYLKHQCSYEAVNTFACEEGISSYWQTDRDTEDHKVVLPKRTTVDSDGIIESLPYHPTSLEYSDYLTFVSDAYFKLLFPRVIYPVSTLDIVCQNNRISFLLDVPGGGYTYIVYISELGISESILDTLDQFFTTGELLRRDSSGNIINGSNDVKSLDVFFKEMFKKLKEKQDNNLIVECDNVGFGISLSTLFSEYDLSKCLIVYSENKLIFSDGLFDLDSVYIGLVNVDNTYGITVNMSYCDINFASNCIYDLATDYTLNVSYDDSNTLTKPNVVGDYKGQDLSFGMNVSVTNKKEDENINITALPLPWYYSTDTTKKYLWSLKKEEIKYEVDINTNNVGEEFEFGNVTIFKNIIIISIKDTLFPFYIKDCKYNTYSYITKYQSYHPMLEYDVDSGFSFLLEQPGDLDVLSQETETTQQPNPNRSSGSESEQQEDKSEVILLKSISQNVVILVPDVEEYLKDFSDEVKLKFTLVKGSKVEYIKDTSECKDTDLFIPGKCDNLEQFKLEDLSSGDTCLDIVKVEAEVEEEDEDEEDDTTIFLSDLIEGSQEYYVEVVCDLVLDEETGTVYKQADIKSISYFYFSYLSFKLLFEELSKEVNQTDLEEPDYANSDIQKILRGEKPLLRVEDLDTFQEAVEGEEEDGQEEYGFSYLHNKTTRSYINNKFYEPFSIDFLRGKEDNLWALSFTKSVSDFYILDKLEKAKEPKDPDDPEPPTEVKHNLTHINDVYRFFGLPICGFNKDKLDINNKYPYDSEESIFNKLVMDNFECDPNKVFYFYILGISKFVQDYIFFVKYNNSIVPILKRIPVIVSQVGLPDPEIKYKWKSKCSVYTYSYDTGLNPFTKVVDSNNLDFFINPFYVIVHKDYRNNKYEDDDENKTDRTASTDYGFLFTSNWWIKYKQKMDNYGYINTKDSYTNNIFLNIYRTLAGIGGEEPIKENIITGFARGKDILYIELESIDYVYSSYCGDHDFSLGNTTPYLYDRASDIPLSSNFEDPSNDRSVGGISYTTDYDKTGVGMRRNRPSSRFIGYMWFPFRACEVSRYNEFSDYSGVRHFIDSESEVYSRSLRGFSCNDLIFKPYSNEDIDFSDFKYLFIDDCFGSINPYRYSSSFYSIDTLFYYESGFSTDTVEVAPTYLPSNASAQWRFMPIFYKDGSDNDYIVIVKPHEYLIQVVTSGTLSEMEDVDKCVVLDVSGYKDFLVDNTGVTVTRSTQPDSGVIRSILYNSLMDIPPMLPYNYNKNKYICGYERMRGGDANFIYQALYPYHHNYTYLAGCKCIFDYKNKGEEAYGPIENTLLPSVINMTTDAEMVVSNSVFYPGLYCRRVAFLPCFTGNNLPLFAYDWLDTDIPYVNICRNTVAQFSRIAEGDVISWVESNYDFWGNYDTLECGTDGPYPIKLCLNKYEGIGDVEDFVGSIFIGKDSECTSAAFMSDSGKYNITNLTSKPLYYHFASAWQQAYDYVLLGASMKSKPVFYGDGSLRMFRNYGKLKEEYYYLDSSNEINNVGSLPVFGGLGKFFRMCYFSTYYGKVSFSTLSGVGGSPPSGDDYNYVYKLSGHSDSDIMFGNNFEYGYLPEKDLVFITDDISLFTSMVSFTEDSSITFELRDCVRFEDLAYYREPESNDEVGYYKYKGDAIEISTFDDEDPVQSGPAFAMLYDKSVLIGDKYTYYSDYNFKMYISEPIFGDDGVIIDPFPFGDNITIKCEPLIYDSGYLRDDTIELSIVGLGSCGAGESCFMEIKVKEGVSYVPWKFYIESENEIINSDGEKEVKTVNVQQAYLCYDNSYSVGKLVQRDDDDEMSLSDHDVIKKGDNKYKINRGFYIDFENMFLPYITGTSTHLLKNLNKANFSTGDSYSHSNDCYCVVPGPETALYIELDKDCFVINIDGSFFSSRKWAELITIGYLCLETSEEFYAVGNLIAEPKFDSAGNNIEVNGKYRYGLGFSVYSNYNKVKYCGTKYKLVFNAVFFFCDGYDDRSINVEYGRFNGGVLANIVFNKISSLKAITYSKNIDEVLGCNTDGIDLYNENLNDKLNIDDSTFYAMPFGFVHKLVGGISEDKEIKFKEGYDNQFSGLVTDISYSTDEQEFLNRITLPVERNIFELIHYPTCFVRFCFKSKLLDASLETDINFDLSLVPNLCDIFGYIPISQWVAPGHRLDLYPDSFYGAYMEASLCNYTYLIKAFSYKSCLDIYINDLDILAKKDTDEVQCNCKELLNWCDISIPDDYSLNDYFIVPYNILFITHVDHGMFGYRDIVDVSDWIEEPAKPTVYEIYDENGELIEED